MAEKTFLDEGGVTITNAHFIVPAQTCSFRTNLNIQWYSAVLRVKRKP